MPDSELVPVMGASDGRLGKLFIPLFIELRERLKDWSSLEYHLPLPMTCSQPSRHLSITWDRNNNPWLFHLVIELQIDHHRPRSPSLWINYFFIGSTICGWHKWFGFICRHPLNLATLDTCWWLRNRVIKKSLILKMKLNDKRWFQNTWDYYCYL